MFLEPPASGFLQGPFVLLRGPGSVWLIWSTPGAVPSDPRHLGRRNASVFWRGGRFQEVLAPELALFNAGGGSLFLGRLLCIQHKLS